MKQQRQEEKIFFEEEEVVRIVTLEHPRVPREFFFFFLPSPIITVVMVGNARCVPICVRVRMPRASITRHPRGCILSIFNLSVESATLSLDSTIEDRDRIEISERRKMKRPLAGDFPTSRIEGNKIYFRHILHSLSLRRRLAVLAMSAARWSFRVLHDAPREPISPTLCYVFVLLVKGWNKVRVGIIYGCIADRIIHSVEGGREEGKNWSIVYGDTSLISIQQDS